MHRKGKVCAGTAVVVSLGFAVAIASPARADAPDAWLTTKAKIALLTSEGLEALDVDVDSTNGVVTLHGVVANAEQRARAESVVARISGVEKVRNFLQIVARGAEARVDVADEQIEERVETALEADRQLARSDIEVGSVAKGIVVLRGKASSIGDELEALRVASRIPGVRRVESRIEVPDSAADGGLAKRGEGEFGRHSAGAEIAGAANDMWITAATKVRLLADDETPALDINVDTQDGVVTLFGIVTTEEEKRAAGENARQVGGVKEVRNELRVVSDERRAIVESNDAELERAVARSLDENARLKSDRIEVAVEDGIVRLTGTVESEDERVAAGFAARSVPGVRAVRTEDLRVAGTG